jgi:hypothetical protein
MIKRYDASAQEISSLAAAAADDPLLELILEGLPDDARIGEFAEEIEDAYAMPCSTRMLFRLFPGMLVRDAKSVMAGHFYVSQRGTIQVLQAEHLDK